MYSHVVVGCFILIIGTILFNHNEPDYSNTSTTFAEYARTTRCRIDDDSTGGYCNIVYNISKLNKEYTFMNVYRRNIPDYGKTVEVFIDDNHYFGILKTFRNCRGYLLRCYMDYSFRVNDNKYIRQLRFSKYDLMNFSLKKQITYLKSDPNLEYENIYPYENEGYILILTGTGIIAFGLLSIIVYTIYLKADGCRGVKFKNLVYYYFYR